MCPRKSIVSATIIFFIAFWQKQQLQVETVIMKLTKLECRSFNESYVDFKKCILKVRGRGKIALQVHARIRYDIPVTNTTVNMAFYLKGSNQRYQPFLYNSTFDLCKFFKNPNTVPLWKIIYTAFQPYTNVNHTCPYNHDIIFENLIFDPNVIKWMPFPFDGDYMVVLRVAAFDQYVVEIRVYFLFKE